MKRALLTMLLLSSLTAMAQQGGTESEAGDVSEVDKDSSGPLRDRVRPVSGHEFLMKGRFEISPSVGFSIKDAFWTKYTPNLLLSFHFLETLGVVLRGGYAISTVSGSSQICESALGCRAPTPAELDGSTGRGAAYGKMGLVADLDLEWAPIYGKLSLLAQWFPGFNMYGMIGPSFVMYGPQSAFTVGGNVGIGFRFFITRWLALRAELRDVIYSEAQQGGSGGNSIRNQLFFDVGLSFFLPTDFTEN